MLSRYVGRLQACQSASEVGRTVVAMVQEIPGLTIDTVKSHEFITILLACTDSRMSGRSVPNFRKAIANAWYGRKE